MKKIVEFLVFIFIIHSYLLLSQNCDTTFVLKSTRQISVKFPFNKYIVENKNVIDIKGDSNSVIIKDNFGNYFIIFDVLNTLYSKIYYKIAENPDTTFCKKINLAPEQLYLYIFDRKGNYLLTGDTIGRNKLLNKKLQAETIYSYIKKMRDVKSFWVIFRNDEEIYKRVIDGSTITKSLWKEIKRLPKGTPIAFIKIMIDYNGKFYPYPVDDFILYR